MSPELTKLLESFNLDNYADLEKLTLADWYTQFKYRESVGSIALSYAEAIPELLKHPLRPQGFWNKLSKEEPIPVEETNLEDMRQAIAWSEYVENPSSSISFNPMLGGNNARLKHFLTLNQEVDDDVILKEVKALLKANRDKIGKFFPKRRMQSWVEHKILQYIDICLLAMSIGLSPSESFKNNFKMEIVHNHITDKEIAFLLFKKEMEENQILVDGQKIRTTCRPIVQNIMSPFFLRILRYHALKTKEKHFINDYDLTYKMDMDDFYKYREKIRNENLIKPLA